MASIRNRSQLKDVHSKEYLESNGGHGLKSSSHMIQTLQASNNMESLGGRHGSDIGKKSTSTRQNIDLQKDLEMKKKQILPPMNNSLNLRQSLKNNQGSKFLKGHTMPSSTIANSSVDQQKRNRSYKDRPNPLSESLTANFKLANREASTGPRDNSMKIKKFRK